MSGRWIAHPRDASFCPHLSFCRGPVRRITAVLLPVRNRSFVAPIQDFRHDSAMRASRHESAHRLLVLPEGSCPENEFCLSAYVSAQASRAVASLPHACQRTQQELGQIADGTNPQTSDRSEGHGAFVRQPTVRPPCNEHWRRFCVRFPPKADVKVMKRPEVRRVDSNQTGTKFQVSARRARRSGTRNSGDAPFWTPSSRFR